MSSASDGEIEGAVLWLENAELFCGGAVGLGLLLEVAIAVINPAYGLSLERWGPVVCDTFVAVGVLGEILFARRVSTCQVELTRRSNDRLALAEKEAAEANRELINFRAPRSINSPKVIEAMRPFAGTKYELAISWDDREIHDFIVQIHNALKQARLVSVNSASSVLRANMNGVLVAVGAVVHDVAIATHVDHQEELRPAVEALTAALREYGLPVTVFAVAGADHANKDAIHIMVGRKS